ncbi:DUF262 domain-containing protein [Caniella muris]|uniref:DUF262 domain-containing protein n=1 Tax=Caniella muris TaxID=2941502 RepID=UPI0020418E74|nr:DUF262 domain-containing protein [Caniella muris]
MKGRDMMMYEVMRKAEFVVPVYQRNYDWTEKQCGRLFDDLENLVARGLRNHFFGSVVISGGGLFEDQAIIDGQQRITTLYLLYAAICQAFLKDGTEEGRKWAEVIRSEYLFSDSGVKGPLKLRLKLVKDDAAALTAIANGAAGPGGSNVTENYAYIAERIERSPCSLRELVEAMERLVVITVQLGDGDDPQSVFESLNSTGLDLSEGDKIRNFVLMDIPLKDQEHYYEQYWNVVERNTDYDVSSFARHYLAMANGVSPKKSGVYEAFKETNSGKDMTEVLAVLRDRSETWRQIAQANTGIHPMDKVLERLDRLDLDVLSPYIMGLLTSMGEGALGPEEVTRSLSVVESYVFRRWVAGVATSGLNKVFVTLHRDVLRALNDNGELTYDQALRSVLKEKTGSSRFIDDTTFRHSVATRDFYRGVKANMRCYVFDRIENGDSPERVDVVGSMEAEKPTLTIEHVMPQTLTPEWRRALGPEAQEIHETWVNRIANLTLTGYNSRYSNKPFSEKRDMEDGFSDSRVHLNSWVAAQDEWTLDQLKERNRMMQELFLELWPGVEDAPCLKSPNRSTVSLADDPATNKTLASWTLWDDTHKEGYWRNMYVDVLKTLAEADPDRLRQVALQLGNNCFSSGQTPQTNVRIAADLWAHTGMSVWRIVRNLCRIFEGLDLDPEDLTFEVVQKGRD